MNKVLLLFVALLMLLVDAKPKKEGV
jgi:hypothetical protein